MLSINFIDTIAHNQFLALFLSITFGYMIGKIRIGSFTLGGIGGTLIAAILISIIGGKLDNQIGDLGFACFLFAVGYDCGPHFVKTFNTRNIKHVLLTIFLVLISLVVVIACAKLFNLTKGMAVGIAAGSLTTSGIIGAATDSLNNLNYTNSELSIIQNDIATGFAITYLFGTIFPAIFCTTILELLYKRNMRSDALLEENTIRTNEQILVKGGSQNLTLQPFVLMVIEDMMIDGKTVSELEKTYNGGMSVHKIRRNGQLISVKPQTQILKHDKLLISSKPKKLIELATQLGSIVTWSANEWGINLVTKDIIITNKKYDGLKISKAIEMQENGSFRRGCLLSVKRNDKKIDHIDLEFEFHIGDIVEVYGIEEEVNQIAHIVGEIVAPNSKTDLLFLAVGLVCGQLIGLFKFNIFSVSFYIGVLGMLFAGITLGWLNNLYPKLAYVPKSVINYMQDFGITTFIAGIGLSTGAYAISGLWHDGGKIFFIGFIVVVVPLLLTYLFGRFILKYKNISLFAAALCGARNAEPAFSLVLERSGNFIPTLTFSVAYTIANTILITLGPIIISII